MIVILLWGVLQQVCLCQNRVRETPLYILLSFKDGPYIKVRERERVVHLMPHVVVCGGPLGLVLVCELFSLGRESSAAIVFLIFLELLLKIISCFFKELEPAKTAREGAISNGG